jgi:3-deoxy-7-phosphoheptulonate synthase
VEGRQELTSGKAAALTFGQSITDACIGWEDSVGALETLARAVKERRRKGKR